MPEFVVAEAGARLDSFVAAAAQISRAEAVRLIIDGSVTVDGEPAQKSMRLDAGMTVEVAFAEEAPPPAAEVADVPIVFEDQWLIVIAKPAGLVVHPAPGHPGGTLVNALLARGDDAPVGGDDDDRPGIVHRLDATTSGLMIVAKHADAHARLVEMMAAREVNRVYLALIQGSPDSDTATIDAPIGRSPRHRKKMSVVAGGKHAITHIEVLERFEQTSYIEARLETGRTHQIRVHLQAIEHPIVGDSVYGGNAALARELACERPFLHAARLSFAHPMTDQAMSFEEPLPQDLAAVLGRARGSLR